APDSKSGGRKVVLVRVRPGAPTWHLDGVLIAPKYVNLPGRARLLGKLERLPCERRLFVLTLIWTGARVSEVLALTAQSFQVDAGVMAIDTLKRRRPSVREVPVPPHLVAELDRHFGFKDRQLDPQRAQLRLWPLHKELMRMAGIDGVRASGR